MLKTQPLGATAHAPCSRWGGVVSVQVLNEFANVLRRKQGREWSAIEEAIMDVRTLIDRIVPITLDTHVAGLALARDHGFSFYDARIVAAACDAGCDTLFSEDMQNGRQIGGLAIVDPFY